MRLVGVMLCIRMSMSVVTVTSVITACPTFMCVSGSMRMGMIGSSVMMFRLKQLVSVMAALDVVVLLVGVRVSFVRLQTRSAMVSGMSVECTTEWRPRLSAARAMECMSSVSESTGE